MQAPSIMPAAGDIKTVEQVRELAILDTITDITVGSFTLLPREGNEGNNFAEISPGTYINSLGMPNGGLQYLMQHINEMIDAAGTHPLRVSIAPIEECDLANLAYFLSQTDIQTIEINCGCPNVWDGGERHAIVSHDLDALRIAVYEVMAQCDNKRIAVKLSPLPRERVYLTVRILHELGVNELVTMNTRPGWPSNGRIAMSSGGLSGKAIQNEATEQTRLVRAVLDELNSDIVLTGVGGIDSGQVLGERLDAGADQCQIGSAFFWGRDPRVFGEILSQHLDLVA